VAHVTPRRFLLALNLAAIVAGIVLGVWLFDAVTR
jgi:hypothetical protein